MVSIALVKSHSRWQKYCLPSNVEHNSLLFSPAFIFIPYLKTLLLTCIIKVGPLSVTSCMVLEYFVLPDPLLQPSKFRVRRRFKESRRSHWTLHFCFLPLDGVKLFSYSRNPPLLNLQCLCSTAKKEKVHFSSCKSVMVICWWAHCWGCTRLGLWQSCWCLNIMMAGATVSPVSVPKWSD